MGGLTKDEKLFCNDFFGDFQRADAAGQGAEWCDDFSVEHLLPTFKITGEEARAKKKKVSP